MKSGIEGEGDVLFSEVERVGESRIVVCLGSTFSPIFKSGLELERILEFNYTNTYPPTPPIKVMSRQKLGNTSNLLLDKEIRCFQMFP